MYKSALQIEVWRCNNLGHLTLEDSLVHMVMVETSQKEEESSLA